MDVNDIVQWTKDWFAQNGRDTAVLGISGGKDSAVVAALLAKAIGPENVYGIMMPNGYQADLEDSRLVIQTLEIQAMPVNIDGIYNAFFQACLGNANIYNPILGACGGIAKEAAINVAPRLRMTVLYAIAQSLSAYGKHACVIGTGNAAERYIGYCTKWGDMACDMNPLGRLWVREVIELGEALAPELTDIIRKKPDDGLCGMTDEERLGFSYREVEDLVCGTADVSPAHAEKIQGMHAAARHKLAPIPMYSPISFT